MLYAVNEDSSETATKSEVKENFFVVWQKEKENERERERESYVKVVTFM